MVNSKEEWATSHSACRGKAWGSRILPRDIPPLSPREMGMCPQTQSSNSHGKDQHNQQEIINPGRERLALLLFTWQVTNQDTMEYTSDREGKRSPAPGTGTDQEYLYTTWQPEGPSPRLYLDVLKIQIADQLGSEKWTPGSCPDASSNLSKRPAGIALSNCGVLPPLTGKGVVPCWDQRGSGCCRGQKAEGHSFLTQHPMQWDPHGDNNEVTWMPHFERERKQRVSKFPINFPIKFGFGSHCLVSILIFFCFRLSCKVLHFDLFLKNTLTFLLTLKHCCGKFPFRWNTTFWQKNGKFWTRSSCEILFTKVCKGLWGRKGLQNAEHLNNNNDDSVGYFLDVINMSYLSVYIQKPLSPRKSLVS